MELSEQQSRFFDTFGFLKFPSLFRNEVEAITEAFEKVWTDSGRTHDFKERSMIAPFADLSEYLSGLLDDHRIDGVVGSVLGEDYNYAGSDGNYYVGRYELAFGPSSLLALPVAEDRLLPGPGHERHRMSQGHPGKLPQRRYVHGRTQRRGAGDEREPQRGSLGGAWQRRPSVPNRVGPGRHVDVQPQDKAQLVGWQRPAPDVHVQLRGKDVRRADPSSGKNDRAQIQRRGRLLIRRGGDANGRPRAPATP